jgi:hypothetical protein
MVSNVFAASMINGVIVFSGEPVTKTEIVEGVPKQYDLGRLDSVKYRAEISKAGSKYYWTSRGNLEMDKRTSGIYTTFTAVNGSGYVRVDESRLIKKSVVYTEHVTLGLNSITYLGVGFIGIN